jgi:protein gp37
MTLSIIKSHVIMSNRRLLDVNTVYALLRGSGTPSTARSIRGNLIPGYGLLSLKGWRSVMAETKIEWTKNSDGTKGKTYNPVTGCTKISPGCQNCYAERMSKRLAGRCGYPKDDPYAVTLHPDRLNEPLRWKKPSRIFVCSMSDLFHDDIPARYIFEVLDVIRKCPQHIFQVLTKRPERMRDIFKMIDPICQYKNLWLGVTAENQEQTDKRIPVLSQTPAEIRFVSVEPMLGPVDLSRHLMYLDWVICGSESGPGRRPTEISWIRSLRDQCVSAGVSFFLKQMDVDGQLVKMPELEGKTWAQFPQTTV